MPSPEARSRSPRKPRSRSRSRSPGPRRSLERAQNDRVRDRRRSRSRNREQRSRSRSTDKSHKDDPPEQRGKKPNYSKAFKWKSKGSAAESHDKDDGGRNYRSRNDEYRPNRFGGRDDRDRRIHDNRERDRDRDRDRRSGIDEKRRDERRSNDNRPDRAEKPAKAPPLKQSLAGAGVTFILVTVNDRLGTKATIPCLGSDTVGDFKKMVAAKIGRRPHEIMLKRQGERPFKDNITLEDYGVSNGVQLDLELDTGD